MKEVRQICRYLREVVSHEHLVSEMAVARDAKAANF
jgi:hypothetical protein